MIINGREIAQQILDNLKLRVQKLNRMPHLAVVLVGDDPAITSYIRQKEKMAREIGSIVSVYKYPVDTTNEQILEAINFLQTKGEIDGIILQLPIPRHLNETQLLSAIHPKFDVDGFHSQSPFEVPIASAVLHILDYVYHQEQNKHRGSPSVSVNSQTFSVFSEDISSNLHNTIKPDLIAWLSTKTIIVIGKGKTGGQPVIDLLHKLKLEPTIIDSQTKQHEQITRQADIIITAAGKRGVVKKEMLKKDAILIGIGMHKSKDGKFYGDYDEEEIKNIASFYTPIPGGVGPVNVAKLMENLVLAAEKSTDQTHS